MKIHIVKINGDSVLIPDVQIVHIDKYLSCAERSCNIQVWSDPIQHEGAEQRTEIVFDKIATQKTAEVQKYKCTTTPCQNYRQ